MTWQAAAILAGAALVIVGAGVGLVVWLVRRARTAEAAAAVERAEAIELRVNADRARALEEVVPLSDDELRKKADELAGRIEADLKRRGPP